MPEKFKRMNRKWAKKIGPNTYEVINRIFLKTKSEEQAYNPTLAVLRLGGSYSNERLEKPVELHLTVSLLPVINILGVFWLLSKIYLKNNKKIKVLVELNLIMHYLMKIRGSDYFKSMSRCNKNGGKDEL